MQQESKIKRIFQAFTDGADIPDDVVSKRRSICDTCPLNSNNSKTLTLLQKQRKAITGEDNPFCTACGCQINEKTARGSEACGLEEKGLNPKWGRIYLNTVGEADINIENLSPEIINLSINNLRDGFKVETLDDIKIGTFLTFELKLDREFGFNVYCSCLSKTHKLENNILKVEVDTNNFSDGNLLKTVEIVYKDHLNKPVMNKITIKGKLIHGEL